MRRTGGNPFFLEALLEAGAAEELPAGVAELVAARVGSLGKPVRRLLEAAAVLGQELDTDLLARVSGQSLDETLDALDDAAAARLLVPAADGAGRVAFAHALVREALAQTLPPARGARLHARRWRRCFRMRKRARTKLSSPPRVTRSPPRRSSTTTQIAALAERGRGRSLGQLRGRRRRTTPRLRGAGRP